MTRHPNRFGGHPDGFALLTVLWVLVGMTMLGMLVNETAQEAIGSAQNRASAVRMSWVIEGCLARAQSAMDDALHETRDVDSTWSVIDELVLTAASAHGCRLVIRPVGAALNVNDADWSQLTTLLVTAGLTVDRADSLASAIIDWRDEDDDALPKGVEQAWYRAERRQAPRNAAFRARPELHLVRGYQTQPEIDELLDVEPGRILLTRAPASVLATLPGMGREAVTRALALREAGALSLQSLAAALSPDARRLLQAHLMELMQLVTTTPDAWVISSTASRGTNARSSVEILVARTGRRTAILRHRSNPWS